MGSHDFIEWISPSMYSGKRIEGLLHPNQHRCPESTHHRSGPSGHIAYAAVAR